MSTAADLHAFEHSVEPRPDDVLFNGKRWAMIQDSSSNTGQYSSQIQFNLSSISSQASFVNWEEAEIQLPIKLQILNGGSASVTSTAAATPDQLVPKAGSWSFIDSVQVVIDGVTVQSNQIHENVNATFRALTNWTDEDVKKHGSTSLFALDHLDTQTSGKVQSLHNLATASMISSTLGEVGLASSYVNSGMRQRAKQTGIKQTSGSLAFDVMGGSSNMQSVGSPQTWSKAAGATAVNEPFYVAHYVATIKLRDVSDYFRKCPMQKNCSGYLYINFNSSETLLTTNAVGVVSPASISSMATNMLCGNTCPVLYNFTSGEASADGAAATGLAVPSGATLKVTADVNGTPTVGTGITPSQSFSRLLVPTYSPNPSADSALSQKKTFRYLERITNKFTVAPGANFSWTISNGIANPKLLFMQPVITNPASGATIADVINPLRSPLSTVPTTCSPFAAIKNLQVSVGNITMYNSPVNFGFEQFRDEMASGIDGGLDDTHKGGLLTKELWESLYRFVAVDIGRRLPSEDGAARSVLVSGTSNCAYPMTIYYHVLRDAVATVDTAMGTVSQAPVQRS